MSDMYAIKASTLTALGDAVRGKVGETRPEVVDYYRISDKLGPNETSIITALDLPRPAKTIVLRIIEEEGRRASITFSSANSIYFVDNEYTYTETNNDKTVFMISVNTKTTLEPYSYTMELIPYDLNGEPILHEIPVPNTMTLSQMTEKISNMPIAPTTDELTLTGNCQYRFYQGGWDWFLEKYGAQMTTRNITNANFLFMNVISTSNLCNY